MVLAVNHVKLWRTIDKEAKEMVWEVRLSLDITQ